MCGIFGQLSTYNVINSRHIEILAKHALNRGKDSSGLIFYNEQKYNYAKADYEINKLYKKIDLKGSKIVIGHSRLITNGSNDNQPVIRDGIIVFHNGIITNADKLWEEVGLVRNFKIDSEIINALTSKYLNVGIELDGIPEKIFKLCQGAISAVIMIPSIGKMLLISNTGSLYIGLTEDSFYFSSEKYPLKKIGLTNISQLKNAHKIINIPKTNDISEIFNHKSNRLDLIPKLTIEKIESGNDILLYDDHDLLRCTKCILPSTMPFIEFDSNGVCNYCRNHYPTNQNKSDADIVDLIEKYRDKNGEIICLIPYSGGRDSTYALYYAVEKLGLKVVTYTYDWGMVTDLARRNISNVCSQLGVENIVIAANIEKKRKNIRLNLQAWLKKPELGMLNLLMAGDKHFFKYNSIVKKQNDIRLELWGINGLERTHF